MLNFSIGPCHLTLVWYLNCDAVLLNCTIEMKNNWRKLIKIGKSNGAWTNQFCEYEHFSSADERHKKSNISWDWTNWTEIKLLKIVRKLWENVCVSVCVYVLTNSKLLQMKLAVRIQFNNFSRKIYLYLNSNFMWCDFMTLFAFISVSLVALKWLKWINELANCVACEANSTISRDNILFLWFFFSSCAGNEIYIFSSSVEQCNNKKKVNK